MSNYWSILGLNLLIAVWCVFAAMRSRYYGYKGWPFMMRDTVLPLVCLFLISLYTYCRPDALRKKAQGKPPIVPTIALDERPSSIFEDDKEKVETSNDRATPDSTHMPSYAGNVVPPHTYTGRAAYSYLAVMKERYGELPAANPQKNVPGSVFPSKLGKRAMKP